MPQGGGRSNASVKLNELVPGFQKPGDLWKNKVGRVPTIRIGTRPQPGGGRKALLKTLASLPNIAGAV